MANLMNNQLVILSICSIGAVMLLLGSVQQADAAVYMKLGDIKGESTDNDHKEWINLDSMSSAIQRSIKDGAKDVQRTKGETTLGDIVVVKELDKSSVKIQESCANGSFYDEVEIHFTRTIRDPSGEIGREQTYLIYKLKDVIVTSYSFHGNAAGDPLPTEEMTLGYTEVEWTYIVTDPITGEKTIVPAKYNPAKGEK